MASKIEASDPARSGLRGRKRARTEARIRECAIRLFREAGVRATSLRAVAEASEVAPATLFNYFPTKSALAEAWVRGEVEEDVAGALVGLGDHGLRSAMRGLSRALASRATTDRPVRLEAWREAGRATADRLGEGHPLVAALALEQQRERVRRDLPARALAELVLDAIEGGLIEGLRSGASEMDTARAIRARVDLVLDGARKRNERVAAPTAKRRAASPAMGARTPEA